MRPTNQKGFKPLLLKTLALFMGICYLLAPLHRQINVAFHSVSHFLEIPVDVMEHTESDFFEGHPHDNHFAFEVNHQHEVIDFLHSLFKASDHENGPNESLFTTSKIDKHFFSAQYAIKPVFSVRSNNDFDEVVCLCNDGYSRQLYAPPRSFFQGKV